MPKSVDALIKNTQKINLFHSGEISGSPMLFQSISYLNDRKRNARPGFPESASINGWNLPGTLLPGPETCLLDLICSVLISYYSVIHLKPSSYQHADKRNSWAWLQLWSGMRTRLYWPYTFILCYLSESMHLPLQFEVHCILEHHSEEALWTVSS